MLSLTPLICTKEARDLVEHQIDIVRDLVDRVLL